MQPSHADRDHALWSASASSRNFACPGALALTMGLPDRTSEAADWGTVAHELGEMCLRDGGDADRFIGTRRKGKVHEFEVNEEMADCAQQYVDYVLKVWKGDGPVTDRRLWIEQRFDLSALGTPFDAGGTGDAVIYLPAERRLEVVDLKGGRGVVVNAKGNPQLRTYALGALLANKGLQVDSVTVTIVQPRAPHPDGRIRSETIDVAELMDWTLEMLEAMNLSKQALDAKADLEPAAWAAAFLNPGPHCGSTFCKASATCPALENRVLSAFKDESTGEPKDPRGLNNPDDRAERLDLLDMIEDWVKQVRAHEHRLAEDGNPATGYVLVEKVGREKWNEDAEEAVAMLCDLQGLDDAAFRNPGKLRTPKQVRDALKKAKADPKALEGLSSTPKGGTNLVRQDGTVRQKIVAPTISMFSNEANA